MSLCLSLYMDTHMCGYKLHYFLVCCPSWHTNASRAPLIQPKGLINPLSPDTGFE